MATLWWAGIVIDPEIQGTEAADALNRQLDAVVARLPDNGDGESGTVRIRYLEAPGVVLADITRDNGRQPGPRIGFGRLAVNEEAARSALTPMQQRLNAWGIDALASAWAIETRGTAQPRAR